MGAEGREKGGAGLPRQSCCLLYGEGRLRGNRVSSFPPGGKLVVPLPPRREPPGTAIHRQFGFARLASSETGVCHGPSFAVVCRRLPSAPVAFPVAWVFGKRRTQRGPADHSQSPSFAVGACWSLGPGGLKSGGPRWRRGGGGVPARSPQRQGSSNPRGGGANPHPAHFRVQDVPGPQVISQKMAVAAPIAPYNGGKTQIFTRWWSLAPIAWCGRPRCFFKMPLPEHLEN